MGALFADLLPDHVLRRTTKAHFTRAFFNGPTREFARVWQGPVPEPDVVVREPLRGAWLSELHRYQCGAPPGKLAARQLRLTLPECGPTLRRVPLESRSSERPSANRRRWRWVWLNITSHRR